MLEHPKHPLVFTRLVHIPELSKWLQVTGSTFWGKITVTVKYPKKVKDALGRYGLFTCTGGRKVWSGKGIVCIA